MTIAPEHCVVCDDSPVTILHRGDYCVLRSQGCGLQWRSPFPKPIDLGRLYDYGYFERWGVDSPKALVHVRSMKEASYRSFFRELLRHKRSGRLLDVGCAMGFLLGVARKAGFDVYGLDVSTEAIRIAHGEFGDRVQVGTLAQYPFPNIEFDVVTLIDVLEHIPDPATLLDLVRRRLVPGGIMLAVLPNVESLMRRVMGRYWPHYTPEHLFHWTPTSLVKFLEAGAWHVRVVQTGICKSFTASYIATYCKHIACWFPPGLGLLGGLRLRIPTGEMLIIAEPRSDASMYANTAGPESGGVAERPET